MRAETADHGAQRSRNEHADPVAEVRLGSFASFGSSGDYLRSSPGNGHRQGRLPCLKGANRRKRACTPLDNFLSEDLAFTRKGQNEYGFSCWQALRPPLDAVLAHAADE